MRELTRYRWDLTAGRTRRKQRAEKLLEGPVAIKVASALAVLPGVTSRPPQLAGLLTAARQRIDGTGHRRMPR